MSYFLVFFDVLAQISAPVARHGWRLWEMKAGAWSFHLPKSQPRASHWHLQIAKTSLGVVFWAFWVTFLCFLSGCLGSLVLANASSCLELRFARVSAEEEPLAQDLIRKRVLGIFSERFGSLCSVFFRLPPPASASFAAWDFLGCFGLAGVAVAASFEPPGSRTK